MRRSARDAARKFLSSRSRSASRPGCAGTSRSLSCAFQNAALEVLTCVGNGGLTSSHFVLRSDFCIGDGLVPPLPFRSPAAGGLPAFNCYFEPGSLLMFGLSVGELVVDESQNIECWCKSYASVT